MATTLDPANIHNFAGVGTLSNGNLTLASTGNSTAQSTTTASGKKTFQYTISAGVTFWPTSGLCSSSAASDGFRIGFQAAWTIYNSSGAAVITGPSTPTPAAGMVVTVDVDTVGNTVSVRANGTTVWSNLDISALAPTTWRAIIWATDASQSGTTFSNTVAFSGLTYPPLSGYSSWDASGTNVSITGASVSALAGPIQPAPLTMQVNGGGAGSYTFQAAGTVTIDQLFGAGASAGRRGHGSGGGAFAANNFGGSGFAVAAGDILYWNVPNGPVGTTATSGTTGTDAWARFNTNAAPTSTTDGALADAGVAGTSTADGTGGTVANSIGTTRFAGGNGSSTGSGTTLRGGGGSSAGTGTNGNNASGTTAGSAPTGGGAGGAGTTSATGGSGTSPGGGGGSTSSSTGTGGAGGNAFLQFTFQLPAPVNVNLTGAAVSALAGTVTAQRDGGATLTGASASALAGSATTTVAAPPSGAAASALAGTVSEQISDSVSIIGASASALAGTAGQTASVPLAGAAATAQAGAIGETTAAIPTGAGAQALAGTAGRQVAPSAAGASVTALAGAVAHTATAGMTGAAVQAVAGGVTTSSSTGSSVTVTGATVSALAGGVALAISDAADLVGASATASGGQTAPRIDATITGAACAAVGGVVSGAVSVAQIGALAAALAGIVAAGALMPLDGAEAAALAGPVSVTDTSAVAIGGASVAAVAGGVSVSIVVMHPNPNYIARGAERQTVAIGRPRARIARGESRRMVAAGSPRGRIARAAERNRIVVGISNAMSSTNNLTPPIDATVEEETVTFDYGLILKPGVTLTGTPTVTCEVFNGTDDAPASRIIGTARIGDSPNTGAPNAAVYQLVGNMLAGTTYRLQCVCTTSDGQTLSLWTHLGCDQPD